MEDNKYYTPSIEEFHVGFEYQHTGLLDINQIKEEFYNFNYDLKDKSLEEINYAINNNWIRVKYLDQEDIESLGWTFKSTNKMRTWYTGSDNWFNNTIPTGNSGRYWSFELSHDPEYNGIIIKAGTNYGETDTFFEGTIKNKSELKKLMEQLNIR